MASDPTLTRLSGWLAAPSQREIRLALVFGSFAKGNYTDESDLDLAIACDHPLGPDDKIRWADQVSKLTGREVDLVDLRTATGTVLTEAMTTGSILKQDPHLFAEVLKRMWLEHEDFEKSKQRILAERRKKVLGG